MNKSLYVHFYYEKKPCKTCVAICVLFSTSHHNAIMLVYVQTKSFNLLTCLQQTLCRNIIEFLVRNISKSSILPCSTVYSLALREMPWNFLKGENLKLIKCFLLILQSDVNSEHTLTKSLLSREAEFYIILLWIYLEYEFIIDFTCPCNAIA